MKKIELIFYVFALTLTSCFKDDVPVQPYQSPAGVKTAIAEMGKYYQYQLYFDLETHNFIKKVDRNTWDLAFTTHTNEHTIWLNSANLMRVATTNKTNFSDTLNTQKLTFKYDNSDGSSENTAFGFWANADGVSNNKIYIVDRGYNHLGEDLGKVQVQLGNVENNTYVVKFKFFDSPEIHQVTLQKNEAYNHVFLSFSQKKQVEVEPLKTQYDLLFTQYTALVEQIGTGIVENYSVNGVFINPFEVEVATEFTIPFEEIIYTHLELYDFTTKRDIIGYDWKEYNFDKQNYSIYSNKVYLVKTAEENYYKIRFVSFTNENGERGYPTVEISKF